MILRVLVPELVFPVHAMHEYPGVAATLVLSRERLLWLTMSRYLREYVPSCRCRMRKRSISQQIAMLPGCAIQPWEVIKIGPMCVGVESLSGNIYLLLVVDKASRFPFSYPLPSKQVKYVARHLLELCLTLGISKMNRSDGGGDFEARCCIQYLRRRLRTDIQYGPADNPRGQGSVERLGGWMKYVLSGLCTSCPNTKDGRTLERPRTCYHKAYAKRCKWKAVNINIEEYPRASSSLFTQDPPSYEIRWRTSLHCKLGWQTSVCYRTW